MAKKKDISEVKNNAEVLDETTVSKPKRNTKAKKTDDLSSHIPEREIIETPRKRSKKITDNLPTDMPEREIIEIPRKRKTKSKDDSYHPNDDTREIIENPRARQKSKTTYEPEPEIWIPETPKSTRRSEKQLNQNTKTQNIETQNIETQNIETQNIEAETANVPQTSEASDAEPLPLFSSTTKLTRRKGKTVPAQTVRSNASAAPRQITTRFAPGAQTPSPSKTSQTQTQPAATAFEPRILTPTVLIPEPGSFDLRLLKSPMRRPSGITLSMQTLQATAIRHIGLCRAAEADRAPCLAQPQFIAPKPDAEITSLERNMLCQMLHDNDIMDIFRGIMKDMQKWQGLVFWYGPVGNLYLDLLNALQPAEAQAMNLSALIDTQDDAVQEEAAPDPAVEALFEIFKLPIVPYVSDAIDPDTIRRLHISHHCDRISALLCDWARALNYIDKGVFGGPENTPLSMCFMERFQKILEIDQNAAENQGVILPDIAFKQRFYLDDVDMLLLWLLATAEMDPNYKNALRETWESMTVVYMSTGALMRFFCTSALERSEVMDRLSPSSAMAKAGLFRIQMNSAPTQPLFYEIIISEQVTQQFAGVSSLSLASTQFAELLFPHFDDSTYVAESHLKTFRIIQNYIDRPKLNRCANLERENLDFVPSMAFLVEGLPGSGRTTLIKIMASRLKKPVIVVQTHPLASLHPTDAEEYLKSVFADAALMDAFLCLRDAGGLLTEEKSASMLARQLAKRPVVCALCVDLAVKTLPVIDPYITFKTKMDGNLKDNAVAYWAPHLNLPNLERSQIDVLALSQRMALQPFQIQKATKLAYYSANFESGKNTENLELNAQTLSDSANELLISNKELEKAAAVQVTKNIGNLAFVTDPEIDLSDVVVSDDIMEKIHQIIGSAINRRRVLYEWGLSKRIRRGTGVIALFDGEPGTGKTHSAEAIAHELGLSLMRVNIATMVDKYIGETEKNLTMIFEQARPDMQLLLFDEADSLFTKRTSNVSKSNDRYSNMSVNVLLQLVERYEGVSILTTNLKNAIDPAFERRITYKVYFPMPKKPERERLWKYMCPPDILTAEPIDYEWLSELEMSGGEIKNAVLTAAFTAATRGQLLDSAILYNAGVAEASAAGRVMRRYEEGEDFV